MELYSLVKGAEVIGYRVVVPELKRAYDINANLFKSYASGVLDLVNLKSLFMHQEQNGKWYTEGEKDRREGVSTYIELIYDTEVCNLIDILSYARNCVFGETKVTFRDRTWVVEDIDLSQGILMLGKGSGLSRDADTAYIKEVFSRSKTA